ncbi:putative ABC transport system permease protein [Propionibacterium cyclohexanicum]|uniref:Putative ABC transport system permease protein n=1 Tax=Propionibacterium cyclohexanicum TaxID=64702 RepID=A0A1H9QIU8_9ACTN|nr:ABC transporter permease [Propionibacterium cyclohexanicum]SER59759.1 putative ABC transport system permease protein [Propionibacterium cyclohexanicum]
MTISPSWQLAVALAALVALGMVASGLGRMGLARAVGWASARATVQLFGISFIVVLCIGRWWSSALFLLAMFAVAVRTTTARVGVRRAWPWSASSIAAGVLPVLAAVFCSGAAPVNGYALLPIGSIMIGNMMSVHTLNGRRAFPALRDGLPSYEAALSVGLQRGEAIGLVLAPVRKEAVLPEVDSVRTSGLVTLPGAFIGVLLGGGTAVQAGASQLLVLFGILSGQIVTVVTMNALIRAALLLPDELHERLIG